MMGIPFPVVVAACWSCRCCVLLTLLRGTLVSVVAAGNDAMAWLGPLGSFVVSIGLDSMLWLYRCFNVRYICDMICTVRGIEFCGLMWICGR